MNELKNNYCIILAGGIGSRLWPYSREQEPKQFLDVFGMGRTMLQLTYDRFARFLPLENIYVSTYADYTDLVRQQLPQLSDEQLVVEPVQLGTAPATALAMAYIAARNEKANVIISPADQLIIRDDEFEKQVLQGFPFVEGSGNFLVLGVKATTPETTFGYIQAGEHTHEGFAQVKSFTEKPSLDFARFFVDSGEFYWSTGLFLCNVDTVMKALAGEHPDLISLCDMLRQGATAQEVDKHVRERYPRHRFQAIDLLILEQNRNVYIAPCTFGWRDVGGWSSFYRISQKDGHGNVVNSPRTMLYNSHDNIVMVPDGRTAILSDLDGYMVIENDHVLAICKREDAAQVRRMRTDAKMRYGTDMA